MKTDIAITLDCSTCDPTIEQVEEYLATARRNGADDDAIVNISPDMILLVNL